MTVRAQENLTRDEEMERLTRLAVHWLERAAVCLSGVADIADDQDLKLRVQDEVHTLRIMRRRAERLS